MELGFYLDTHGTYVSVLKDELEPLEQLAKTWGFPYGIIVVFRVLPESYGRRTFRRFDGKEHVLTLDMSISLEQYGTMSKDEQREALGIELFRYASESVAAYKKHADKAAQSDFMEKLKAWMTDNGWLSGKIGQARTLLAQGKDLHEVSRELQLPLAEVEQIYFRMNED